MDARQRKIQGLAAELVRVSFANCKAYARSYEEEKRSDRQERIYKAVSYEQQKESIAYEQLYASPKSLK